MEAIRTNAVASSGHGAMSAPKMHSTAREYALPSGYFRLNLEAQHAGKLRFRRLGRKCWEHCRYQVNPNSPRLCILLRRPAYKKHPPRVFLVWQFEFPGPALRSACYPARADQECKAVGLVLPSQIAQSPFVMALLCSGLVASSPPRPVQDEIRRWAFPPYQAGEQPADLQYRHGNQFCIGIEVAPFSPGSKT